MRHLLLLAGLALLASPAAVWAACTSPAGEAGAVIFSQTAKTMQYCNGTNWVNTGASIPSAPQTGCSNPTGTAGKVIYNSALGVVQFCNGSSWVDTSCAADRTPGGSGCTGGKAGQLRYATSANELQFCDSTNWVAMGWGCSGSAASQTGLIDWSLATQIQKITASDGAENDYFGTSVAISDNTAIVGAYDDDTKGSAYVFIRSGNSWNQQAKLTASDGATYDSFGYSVALSGDTVIIGAYGDNSSRGSAYIFTRSGTTWTQQAKLTASDGATGDQFGYSVSVYGDTVLIGALLDKNGGIDFGSAYVFTRSGTTWTQQAKLAPADLGENARFGTSVALFADRALIGAMQDDDLGNWSGSAYIFIRSGNAWAQEAKITAADGASDNYFGSAVSLVDETAIIGSYGSDSAYIFTRSGNAWTQQSKLTVNTQYSSQFGTSVSIYGNSVVVGANFDNSAFIFTRSGNTWSQQAKITPTSPGANDYFGTSVSIYNDTAIIGAYGDVDRGDWAGAAYFFGAP